MRTAPVQHRRVQDRQTAEGKLPALDGLPSAVRPTALLLLFQ